MFTLSTIQRTLILSVALFLVTPSAFCRGIWQAVRSRGHLVPERQDVSSTDKFIVSRIVGASPNHAMP